MFSLNSIVSVTKCGPVGILRKYNRQMCKANVLTLIQKDLKQYFNR